MELEASPCSRNYKTSGIRRKQQRSTNTNCSNAPTQHQLSHVTDTLKTELQRGTRQMKDNTAEKIKERWRGKRMHGQFPCNLDEKLVDNGGSHSWLNLEILRKKKKVQQRQQLAQTVLRIKV